MGRFEFGFNGGVGQGIGNKYFDGGATGLQNGLIIVRQTYNSTSLKGTPMYGALGYVQVKRTDTIRATAAHNWTQDNIATLVPGYYSAGAVQLNLGQQPSELL